MNTHLTAVTSRRDGVGLVACAALLWSTTGLAGVLASSATTPAALAESRALIGGLSLALVVVARSGFGPLVRAAGWSVVVASTALAAFQWGFFAGVRGAGSAIAAIVSAGLSPFVGDLLAAARARGHQRAGLSLALLLMAATIILVHDGRLLGAGTLLAGLFAAAASGVAYAIYADVAAARGRALMERTSTAGAPDPDASLALTALALLGAAVPLFPVAQTGIAGLATPSGLALTAYLGLFATALPYFLFVRGLRHLATGDALAVLILQPLSAAAIGWVVLGERIEGAAAVATVVLLAATALRALRFSLLHSPRAQEKTS